MTGSLRSIARTLLLGNRDPFDRPASSLIERQLELHRELVPAYELISDEQARIHEGEAYAIEATCYRRAIRYFHAWRIDQLQRRLGARLESAEVLDVGDTDGLMLKHLGKAGTGFNLSPTAIANIRSNGIEAVLGDGHEMPFATDSFDLVLCFETLEHVENPFQLLEQLARVCRPDGASLHLYPVGPRHSDPSARPHGPARACAFL